MPPMSRPGARVNEAVFKIIQRNECACVCVSREREREGEMCAQVYVYPSGTVAK